MNFFTRIKEFFRTMFVNRDEIKKITGVPPQISSGMIDQIELWRDIYAGTPPWKKDDQFDKTMGFAKTVCRDIATKATVEATIETGNEELNAAFQPFMDNLTDKVEKTLALGASVARPFYDAEKKTVAVTWYPADRVVPLAWQGETLVSVALLDFVTLAEQEGKTFVKVESHIWQNRTETITSTAHRWESGSIGAQVSLETVAEWAQITPEPIVITNLNHPLFTYMKTPIANNIDGSYIGLSLYANAIDQLEELDKNFSAMAWERWAGESRVFVSDSMIPQKRDSSGKFVDDLDAFDKKLYKKLEGGIEQGNQLFEVTTPALRFDQYVSEANSLIAMACKNMALDAKAFLVDRQGNPVTAEQILSEKNETYTTILSLQRNMILPALYHMLDNVRAMEKLYSVSPRLPEKNDDIALTFGDSVMLDENTEKKMAMDEVNRGVRSKLSYLMDYRGMTEEEAQKELELIRAETPTVDFFGQGEGF